MLRTVLRLSPFACTLLAGSCSSQVPLGNGDPAQAAQIGGSAATQGGPATDGGAGGSGGRSSGTGGVAGTHAAGGTNGAGGKVVPGAGGAGVGTGGGAGSAGIPVTSGLGGGGTNTEKGAGGSAPSGYPTQDGGTFGVTRSPLAHETTSSISPSDYSAFIATTSDFAFDLYGQVAPANSNFVFSPISVEYALGMTLAGAKGDTSSQMKAVMHDTLDDTVFDAALNKLAMDLVSRNVLPTDAGSQSLRLRLVDSAWAQKDYTFAPTYLDRLSRSYDAGIYLADFLADSNHARLLINQWVADQTAQKITNLLAPDSITPLTRLVLVNALYFYGSWLYAFESSKTKDATFHTASGADVTVSMMSRSQTLLYGVGTDYQIVDLPYLGNRLAMTFVLPAEGKFDTIRSGMSRAWLDQARASMTGERGDLFIPKFKFTWGSENLALALRKLGMVDAFVMPPGGGSDVAGTADFSGMEASRELYISGVIHKAFIAVDEAGTEAAASTAIVMEGGAGPGGPGPSQPFEFRADRPFLILIRDTSGALLFCGQVTDPTAGE